MRINSTELEDYKDTLISYREMRETLLDLIEKSKGKKEINKYHLRAIRDILDLSAKLMYDNSPEVQGEIYEVLS